MGIYILPKKLDEEVARLHLDKIGVRLTTLSEKQANYLSVPVVWTVQGGALPVLMFRKKQKGHPYRVAFSASGEDSHLEQVWLS